MNDNHTFSQLSILLKQDGLLLYGQNGNDLLLLGESRSASDPQSLLQNLKKILQDNFSKIDSSPAIQVIYHTEYFSTVPKAIFRENALTDYLKYNSRILPTDFISVDDAGYDTQVVYVAFENINNFLYEQYGSFPYYHLSSRLLNALEKNDAPDQNFLTIYVTGESFYLIYIQNDALISCNLFTYQSKEDVLYYTLFNLEQLEVNTENIRVTVYSDKNEDGLLQLLSKYIHHIESSTTDTLKQEILCV